ncbi:MAG: autotransporter-associated beta strand repeat-containing protein [Verrucomicrobia bacterium]|nr:autotransporter-associated beta strand repeat-containing protein [Verrucomicrobiota bacterium]
MLVRTAFLLLVGFALFTSTLRAQFTYTEDFKGTTANGWVFGAGSGSPYTPTLTAATGVDTPGNGWLRLTDLQPNEATYARLTTPIPSINNNITVTLDLAMWNKGTGGAADGITISLRDASVPFSPGAFGGSLGYANRTGVDGMAGGYFSLGVDNWGNFSNPTEGRNGGTGFVPNSISTRGPGSGQTGYTYLGGTSDLSQAPYSLGQLDFPNSTTRPVQTGNDYRQLVFNLDSSSQLTVSLKFGATGTLTQVYTADLSGFARPENLELVYTGSTGDAQQINEIRNLVVTTTAAPVGNVFYSNYANDNKWGTGANWGNATTPNLGLVPGPTANLIFSNNAFTSPTFQLTTAQNVDLQQNRTAASIQFDAPFNYTLQGYQLTLDNGTSSSAITVTSAQPGGAHSIQSNLQLNSNLNINTNTNTALVIAGNVNAGTKTLTLNNSGTTTFTGQITGSGTITQLGSSAGTLIIAGDSSSTYSGNLDIQRGTLQLGGSNVLNSATSLSLSNAVTGTGTFNLANYSQTLGALTYASGGTVTTGSGTLTMAGNITSAASATEATLSGNLDLGGATRTFDVAQGAAANDLNISAAITGTGAGINKTSGGTLLLSGSNSFTGNSTVSAGTLIAANNNALGTTGSATTTTVASGATLGLQGGITVNGNEQLVLSGTGDTGRAGALDNLSGNNAVAGAVTLAADSRIGAASGTTLTLSGPVGESGGARSLTANGNGTIVLAAANTYTGATTVNAGTTLVAAANDALGSPASGTTVASGGTLGFQGGTTYSTTEAVTVQGTGAAGRNGAIDNLSGTNTFAGNVTLAGATTMGAAAGSQLSLSGVISGAQNLTVGGSGVIVLDGAANNTYSGTTTINSGATLIVDKNNALGTTGNGTTVNAGATLGFSGGTTYSSTESLSVSGTGASGRLGAIENVAGTNSFAGNVALTGATTIGTAGGSQLTLSGNITGASNVTAAGTGTLILTGNSTYSGTTTITDGTVRITGASGNISSSSSLTISNGSLVLDNSASGNANRIGDTAGLTLNDGTFTFIGRTGANSTETVGNLTLGSGANVLNLATGASNRRADLTLNDIIRVGSSSLTISSFSDAAMTTRSTLGQGTTGSARVYLTTDTFNAGGSGISLTGATSAAPIALPGWITTVTASGSTEFVEYSGDSGSGNGIRPVTAYTGALGINVNNPNQVVQLDSSSPTGAYTLNLGGPTQAPVGGGAPNGSGTIGGNVTVDSGLKLLNVATVDLNTDANKRLVLKNGGLLKSGATTTNFIGSGALTSGNGFLAVTVDNAGGTLNLTAPIVDNATGYGTNGAVGLNKSGAGLLILGGTNTYTGGNYLNDGTVRVSSEANLGAASNDVIFSGGTLNVATGFTASAGKQFSVTAGQTGTIDVNAGQTLATAAGSTNRLITSDTLGTLVKAGTGSLLIQDANAGFDGTVRIDAGTVELRQATSLGDATNRGRVTLNGGTLALANNAATSFSNNVTVSANSTITVDRVSSGTNLTHTLGTLSIGSQTLTVTGNNGFDLAFGATSLTGAATLTTNTDVTLGATSGAGSLTKDGTGTVILSAANSYAGATTVNAGILRTLSATAILPANTALTISGGATFDANSQTQAVASLAGAGNVTLGSGTLTVGSNGASTSYSGAISGTGGLTKTGTGTLTLAGANTYSGATNVNQGTVTFGASNVLSDTTAVTVAAPAVLNLAGNSDTIGSLAGAGAIQLGSGTLSTGANNSSTLVSGVVSGSGGSLVKQGTGTMTLSGANTYTGTTTVSAGTLAITSSSGLGSGDGTAGTGTTVASGATLQVSGSVNVLNEALSLSGTGSGGNGALQNVSGSNTLGGPVSLATAAKVLVNSGTLTLNGAISNAGNTLTVDGTGNTVTGGAITGTGGLTKAGVGALVLNNAGNTYSGATNVTGGTIQIGVNGAGPSNSAVTLASGTTLDVNSKTASIGSLAGSAGSSVILGTGALSAGANNASTSFSGVISGAGGSFTKLGSGTLTLSGANSYTGATNINAGVLSAGASTVISNQSAVTVANGAAFTLNNTTQAVGSIAGAGTVNIGSGQFVAGANGSSTTFSGAMTGVGGTFTKDGAGTLTLTGVNTYTGTTTIAGGSLVLGASNALSNSSSLTISSGANLTLGTGVTDTIAGLTTTATSSISLGANSVLTVDRATATTLLGSVSGTGTLAFTGGGNLTLPNNFNLSGGTLAFGGTTIGGTPTSTIFLPATATVGTLRITGDTILDFGNSTASVLNTTNFIIDPGVKVSITNWVHLQDYFYANGSFQQFGGPSAAFDVRGTAPQNQVTFGGFNNSATVWQSWDRQITPAPEPATYGALLMGGALGLFGLQRWRRRTARRST